MKTLLLTLSVGLAGLGLSWLNPRTPAAEAVRTETAKLAPGAAWVPVNATERKLDPNTVVVTAPSGWEYVAITEAGQTITGITSVKISCTCTSGSGCSPSSGWGQKGCVMSDGCSACSGTVSFKAPGAGGEFQTMRQGGFVQRGSKPRFANRNDLQNLAAVADWMLQIDGISAQVSQFLAQAPAGGMQVQTPVVIAGRIGIVSMPKSFVEAQGGLILSAAASCSCTSGSCTLKKSSGVTYCEGNCSGTCTLDTGIKAANGESLTVLSSNF
ncbi:MAG: hypothetical protein NW241_10420 [Bacteroidia bacterium]|nr:hypothetical protein [Bacteroidia bacterium]